MAEKRRLQQEVERTLRRVEEGCELFMDLYVKFKQQQTAKIEGELKKEIKKLQRLRESIKAWQTNVDVRDKGPLEDSRKKIEKCMETFRQCEKEIKTKAFSKEGLAAKTRDGEDRHREALQLLQQQLQREAALLEAEMDGLDSKKGKRDRERDREKKRISLLLQKHKQHITKLTEALRLADSSRLSPSAAAAIAVALQDFLSSNGDPAFVFDSSVYDCIAAEHSDSAEGSETEAADNNSDATLCKAHTAAVVAAADLVAPATVVLAAAEPLAFCTAGYAGGACAAGTCAAVVITSVAAVQCVFSCSLCCFCSSCGVCLCFR